MVEDDSGDIYVLINQFLAFASLFSVPFMILTIFAYFYIKEVRNNYSKAFICYLVGLSIGYITLTLKIIAPKIFEIHSTCKVSGYIAYYFFMMAFFATNVISYDIWSNFRGTRRYEDNKQFTFYALYIFGAPLILFILAIVAQEVEYLHHRYKPGFSIDTRCWLNNTVFEGPLIFFFGPMLVLITANLVMFGLTAFKIYKLQKKYQTTLTTNPNSNPVRNLRCEKARFGLFLRLILLMGVLWVFELASFFAGQTEKNAIIFLVFNFCVAMQGCIIFVLFVLRKPVRHALLKKMCNKQYDDSASEGSYTTNGDVLHGPVAAKLLNLRETDAA